MLSYVRLRKPQIDWQCKGDLNIDSCRVSGTGTISSCQKTTGSGCGLYIIKFSYKKLENTGFIDILYFLEDYLFFCIIYYVYIYL